VQNQSKQQQLQQQLGDADGMGQVATPGEA
jgi:hypothetical protein